MQVHYRWQSNDPKTHIFSVTLSLSGCLPAQVWSLWMPVWAPGSYLVREFSRHIYDVQAHVIDVDQDTTTALSVEKTTKNHWAVQTPSALENGILRIQYRVYAFDTSVRASYFDSQRLMLGGAATWLSIHGSETLPRTLEWLPPNFSDIPWTLATALDAENIDSHGFGTYRATDYLQQIDCPVMAGTHLQRFTLNVENTPHTMVFDDAQPLDLERLHRDMSTICAWHHRFWPGSLPFNHYVTLVQVQASGYGGLEHATSTRLVCARNDLPRPGHNLCENNYTDFISLFSHEYFHSWWVKRLRPHTLLSYSLEAEQYTPLLWIFEGFTAYFDDLSLVQSKLITRERYFKILESLFDRVLNTPAHRYRTLHEASFDAWIRAYRPDENTPNSTVNYYDQGSVLALVLDITLITHHSSLAEVLATLWRTHIGITTDSSTTILAGLTEDDLLHTLHDHAPKVDWKALIQRTVHTPTLPDYTEALKQVGVKIEWTHPSTSQAWAQRLGLRFKERSLVVSHVLHDRPAAHSGVHVGDIWLALNGEQLTHSNWVDLFTRLDHEAHPPLELHFFREGLLQTLILDRPIAIAFHQLRLNSNADDAHNEAATRWLHLHGRNLTS